MIADAQGSDQKLDQERFESVLTRIVDEGLAADCIVALSAKERQAIWALRDDVDQFHQFFPWFGFDVSMPIRHMESYVAKYGAHSTRRGRRMSASCLGTWGTAICI